MAVCLAWIGDPAAVGAVVGALGPWRELVEVADGLLLVETDESLSRVYHELKAVLPDGCSLLVAPLSERPKAKGVSPGTVSWLRERLPLPGRD